MFMRNCFFPPNGKSHGQDPNTLHAGEPHQCQQAEAVGYVLQLIISKEGSAITEIRDESAIQDAIPSPPNIKSPSPTSPTLNGKTINTAPSPPLMTDTIKISNISTEFEITAQNASNEHYTHFSPSGNSMVSPSSSAPGIMADGLELPMVTGGMVTGPLFQSMGRRYEAWNSSTAILLAPPSTDLDTTALSKFSYAPAQHRPTTPMVAERGPVTLWDSGNGSSPLRFSHR